MKDPASEMGMPAFTRCTALVRGRGTVGKTQFQVESATAVSDKLKGFALPRGTRAPRDSGQ